MQPNHPPGKLIIVCGLPGSGKTTHARRLEQKWQAIRFCPDEWMDALGSNLWDTDLRARIEQLQWTLAQNLLALGHTVVIEWGTWARSERDALRQQAQAIGAAAELHFLDAPLSVLMERIRERSAESPPITMSDLATWHAQFERPGAEELSLYDRATHHITTTSHPPV